MAQHGLDVAVLLVGSVAQGDFQRRVALLARHRNAHRNVPKALANRNLDRFVRPLRNVFDERRRALLSEQQRMDEVFARQFQTFELRLHIPHDGVDRSERAGVGLFEHASWLPGKRASAKCAPRLFAGNLTSRLVAFHQIDLEPFCHRRTSMKTTGMLTAHADFGKSRTMFAPLHRQGKPPTCKSLGRVNFAARISLLCTSQRANIGELLPKKGASMQHDAMAHFRRRAAFAIQRACSAR